MQRDSIARNMRGPFAYPCVTSDARAVNARLPTVSTASSKRCRATLSISRLQDPRRISTTSTLQASSHRGCGVRSAFAAAILVPERNTAEIRSFADLCNPGVRIAISTIDCLRGVWEDVAGRAGLVAPISKNITLRVAGCMAIVDAIANARVDAAFGWSSFTHFHPRIAVVPLASDVRVMRATSAAVVRTSNAKSEADAFLEFLAGDEARPLFWKYGWAKDGAS